MNTIEQLFKTKINSDLTSKIDSKYKMIVTNDVSLYARDNTITGKEIFAVLSTGNGTRTTSENQVYITQSLSIYFLVHENYLQSFLALLTKYASEESEQGNVQILGDSEYSLYINYNTPTTDGLTSKIGIYNYLTVILIGQMIYIDNENLSIGTDITFQLGDTLETLSNLTNIMEYKNTKNPTYSAENVQGKSTPVINLNGLTLDYTFTILYDKLNFLHVNLYNASKSLVSTDLIKYFKVDTSTPYQVLLSVTVSGSPVGFKYLSLSLSKYEGD